MENRHKCVNRLLTAGSVGCSSDRFWIRTHDFAWIAFAPRDRLLGQPPTLFAFGADLGCAFLVYGAGLPLLPNSACKDSSSSSTCSDGLTVKGVIDEGVVDGARGFCSRAPWVEVA